MLRHTTVLIAAHHPTPRTVAKKILIDQLNCRKVVEARTGEEAWDLIESGEKIDWIISDWEMPGMTGDEFLLKVRNHPDLTDIPFMIMTSRDDKYTLVSAVQAGVSDVLIKPFSASTLIQKIRKIFLSCERRILERFKSCNDLPAQLSFDGGNKVQTATLVDISDGGCMVRTPHFNKQDGILIYDEVSVAISVETGDMRLKGELVRIERDKDNPNVRNFILVAVQFRDIDSYDKALLDTLIKSIKVELPENIG